MFRKSMIKSLITVSLSLALIASGSTLFSPTQTFAAAASTASTSSSALAQKIIATGEQYLGIPYKFGAQSGNTSSFDCSSFTQYVFKQNGITLPRDSRQQSRVGTYVPRSQLQPGDLVFFYQPIHHVAIYLGNGKLLHTYGAPGVTITGFTNWWSTHYATARRVIPAGGQAVTQAPAAVPVSVVQAPSSTTVSSHATIVNTVKFHTSPSLQSSTIRYLKNGETVTVLSHVNAYWFKVRDKNGKIGYVTTMNKYIRL